MHRKIMSHPDVAVIFGLKGQGHRVTEKRANCKRGYELSAVPASLVIFVDITRSELCHVTCGD